MQWFENEFEIENQKFNSDVVIETLLPLITEERREKLLNIVSRRRDNIIPVLECIYDRGNTSAVMRSAEAFGLYQFYVVENPGEKFKEANRVTAGTEKWVRTKTFKQSKECFEDLKKNKFKILVSDLKATSDLSELDWSQNWAVVFGNEKDGISPIAKEYADASYKIPMHGFAESFNISVAAALTFYHINLHAAPTQNPNKSRDVDVEKPLLLAPPTAALSGQQKQILANYLLRSVSHSHLLMKKLN